jgi:hypothetical protein
VFWPLLAIIKAFIKREYRFLKIFLPLFTGVLGYTYQPQKGSDVNMAIERFEVMRQLSFTSKLENLIVTRFSNLLNVGFEIYIDLVAFITSLFTDNFRWALFFLGYVYGVILYHFFKEIAKNCIKTKSLFYNMLILSIVLFIQPSMALNGRFWLAALLFFHFVVAHYNSSKLKYVLFSLALIFIHKGFIVAIILYFLWYYTKQIKFKKYLYMLLLIVSIVTPGSLMLNQVRVNSDNLSEAYKEKAEGYTREKYVEQTADVSKSRSAIFNLYSLKLPLLFYGATILMFYFYLKKYFLANKKVEDLFFLVILFISFSNFFIEVPTLGGRYRLIASGLMLILILFTLKHVKINFFKIYPNLLLVSLVFAFLVNLRMEFEQLYGFSYILNPVFSFLVVEDFTVMDIIK